MKEQELLDLIERAAEDGRDTLDLSNCSLDEPPQEIGHLPNLTALDLSRNQLTHLPPVIGNFANLTELELAGKFQDTVEFLSRLQYLVLYSRPPVSSFLCSKRSKTVGRGEQVIFSKS